MLAASAAPHVEIMHNSGPQDNRINFVIVGDGYTQNELGLYAQHAQETVDTLLFTSPFREYQNFINIWRVDVISSQSGVSNDPTPGINKNTALGSYFWCSNIERLLCVNTTSTISYANYAPVNQINQIIVLANSTKPGGAGYQSQKIATASASNQWGMGTVLHEVGHSLGGLKDEYTLYSSSAPSSEPGFSNISVSDEAQMLQKQIKWWYWLGFDPVATFGTTDFCTKIGTFGPAYWAAGSYRPSDNCAMRSAGLPFSMQNMEELIYRFYIFVNPVEDASPENAPVQDAHLPLYVRPIQTSGFFGNTMTLNWYLNGQLVESGQNEEFYPADYLPLPTQPQIHQVQVEVVDDTPLVLNPNYRNAMTFNRSWNVKLGYAHKNILGGNTCDYGIQASLPKINQAFQAQAPSSGTLPNHWAGIYWSPEANRDPNTDCDDILDWSQAILMKSSTGQISLSINPVEPYLMGTVNYLQAVFFDYATQTVTFSDVVELVPGN